jgi:serine/threonine protein kinase
MTIPTPIPKRELQSLAKDISSAVSSAVLDALKRAAAEGRLPDNLRELLLDGVAAAEAAKPAAAGGAPAPARSSVVAERNRMTDRFTLLGATGGDAFCETYLGREMPSGNNVMIRLFYKQLATDAAFMANFRRDCENMMAMPEHTHVVKALAHGVHFGQPYVALESVRGKSLADVLVAGDPVGEIDVLRMAEQVASALQHVRVECGIHHGELKPSSIMVEYSGIAGIQATNEIESIKVTDFIGPRVPWHDTAKAPSLGAPFYTAPEQFSPDNVVDARTDVYSLGAIMYHLLTGKPPYSGTVEDVRAGHLGKAILDPGDVIEGLSPQTRQIVSTCLAHSRDDRFISLQGLQAACTRALGLLMGAKVRSMRFLRKPMPNRFRTPLPDAPAKAGHRTPRPGPHQANITPRPRFTTPLPTDEAPIDGAVPAAASSGAASAESADDQPLGDITRRILRKHRERRQTAGDAAEGAGGTTALIRREVAAEGSSGSSRRRRVGSPGLLPVRGPRMIAPPQGKQGELVFYRIAILLLILVLSALALVFMGPKG